MTTRHTTTVAYAALLISILASVMALTGAAGAAKRAPQAKVVRLDKRGKIPAKVLPTVRAARNAGRLGGFTAEQLTGSCPPTSVDLGTWCLLTSPYPLTNEEIGRNNYFFATDTCVSLGGYLPTAAQLLGAANRVKLASTIDDSPLTASVDQDESDGLRDSREMSSTLITTAAGSGAAGSQGVSEGSKGDPKQGEPDPTPLPANPSPNTLQYVTVYDNKNKGGFAGGRPVTQPENFRCAFNKREGAAEEEAG